MNKYKVMLSITIFLVLHIVIGCSNSSVPTDFKIAVEDLNDELLKIDAIPAEESVVHTDGSSYYGYIDERERIKYIVQNIEHFNYLSKKYAVIANSNTHSKWADDALLCRAYLGQYLALKIKSDEFIDKAISYTGDYLKVVNETHIENWTKKKLKKIIWDKHKDFFSTSLTDEMNIKQLFHIGRASIWDLLKNNKKMALEDYKNALAVNPNGLWGQQASMKILELEKSKTE